MSWVTVIWSMGASACLTLSAIYLLVWYKNRTERAHLLFALTAASAGAFAFFELWMMRAQTPQELDTAMRWCQVPLLFWLLSLTWFVSIYLDAGRRWLAWSICGLRVLYVLPNLLLGGNPNLREIPSLQHIQLLGESVTVNRGVPNPWALLGSFTVLLVLVFVADASVTAWRRGDRRKALIVGGSVELFLFTGLVTSMSIIWASLKMPQALSLYNLGLVAVMGYELSRDVLRASQLVRELQASEAGLRESEERFRVMADTAPVLVWRADTANLCDFVNRPWLEFTGRTMEEELGTGWSDGVWPEDLDRSVRTCAAAFEARQPFRMEFRLRRADGAYRWVLDSGVPRYGPDGSFAGYIGSCLDITERKASEDALRESQQRLTMATAAGAVGVWDWNFETNELYVDPGLKSLLGFEDAEITNRPEDWGSRVHPQDAPEAAARVQACIDGATDLYEIEHRMVHKDGSARWFLSRGSAMRGVDGTLRRMVGTKVDITERKRAEAAIREKEAMLRVTDQEIQHLAGRLIAAQEVERSRIARDLHDETSQQLAGLAIALSGLRRRVGASTSVEDLQADVASLQQRTIALAENVRHLSHDLHPSVLEHAGLVAALAGYCTEVQRQQTVAVTFSVEGDFASTDADAALCLYRVAQEGLRNVVAHAGALRADVRLLRTADGAELTIADDGKGFDVAKTRGNQGLGLVSINERVRLAGGTVSIATEVNKGTRLSVRIPANRRARADAGHESGRYATSV